MDNVASRIHHKNPMAYGIGTLAVVMYLLGIAFVMHFSATGFYFSGSDPTGFSTGTVGLFICAAAVVLTGYAAARNE